MRGSYRPLRQEYIDRYLAERKAQDAADVLTVQLHHAWQVAIGNPYEREVHANALALENDWLFFADDRVVLYAHLERTRRKA